MLELYYRPFVVSPPPSVRDGARILGVARRARHINALSVLDQLRATLSRSVKVPVTLFLRRAYGLTMSTAAYEHGSLPRVASCSSAADQMLPNKRFGQLSALPGLVIDGSSNPP
eukprot:scaffold32696_cov59-Phaeocystis_antarctica.AAC.3